MSLKSIFSPRRAGASFDIGILITRVVIGIIFVAHGYQKIQTWGLANTGAAFEAMGAPLPQVSATVAALIELVGGLALIVGLLTPLAGLGLVLDMLGALFIVHIGNGVFIDNGGWELVGALTAATVAIIAAGPGTISADRFIFARGQLETAPRK